MGPPRLPVLLVDGYNLLLAFYRREGVPEHEIDLDDGRARLEERLCEWAAMRGHAVVLVWDGHRLPRPRGAPEAGITVSWAEPPSEADDRIVALAEQYVRERREASVVTHDRGLRRRLPPEVRTEGFESLVDDLEALVAGPVTAAFLGRRRRDDPWLPASSGPVDTSRLPRRRRPLPILELPAPQEAPTERPPPAPATAVAPAPAGRPGPDGRKARGRARYERARARRKKR